MNIFFYRFYYQHIYPTIQLVVNLEMSFRRSHSDSTVQDLSLASTHGAWNWIVLYLVRCFTFGTVFSHNLDNVNQCAACMWQAVATWLIYTQQFKALEEPLF